MKKMVLEHMLTVIIYRIKKSHPLLTIKIVTCGIKRSLRSCFSWTQPHILMNATDVNWIYFAPRIFTEYERQRGQTGQNILFC